MTQKRQVSLALLAAITPGLLAANLLAQGPGGGGRGGPPRSAKTKLVEKFDVNQNGYLDRAERDQARAWQKENPGQSRQRRRRGGRPRFGGAEGSEEARQAGLSVTPGQVTSYDKQDFYDTSILRTLFFTFDDKDWEDEMAAFHRTDVEIPVTLTADGKKYNKVGVRFRGNTSFMTVPKGQKRSLNVSLDLVHKDQRIGGYKTLNLLNCHADPSFLREVLHASLGRQFTPVPKANLVHVVINGESWGIYANVQQVNKDYLKEAYGTKKGARWRVPPDFSGAGGLKDIGGEKKDYENKYIAKSGVDAKAWRSLAEVCKTIAGTTIEERIAQLPSKLDIDGTLWFLAIDNVLLDGDGYLTRASDYMLYLDPLGQFHPVTYDNNEILGGSPRSGGRPGGPPGRDGPPGRERPDGPPGERPERGGRQRGDRQRGDRQRGDRQRGDRQRGSRQGGGRRRGGPGGGRHPEATQGVLAGADDKNRPLLHYLLEVPEWRARYLAFVNSLAAATAWDKLGPEVRGLHAQIADITAKDTRKLYSDEAFAASIQKLEAITTERYKTLMASKELAGAWPEITAMKAEEKIETSGFVLDVAVEVDSPVAEALLHWQRTRPGPFEAIRMQTDDKRVFRATIPPQKHGEKIHYYVEVRSKGDEARLAFLPAGASSMAKPHRFPK